MQDRSVAFQSVHNLTSGGILGEWLNSGRSPKNLGMRLCQGGNGIVGASEFEAHSEVGYCRSCEFLQAEGNFGKPGEGAPVSEPAVVRAQG